MYLENHVSFEKEKTSVSGEFAHQACNDLCVHCLKFGICRILQAILLSEAGLYRHHYRQVLVFSSGIRALAVVIMSLRMTFMRYGTKLADYPPYSFETVA